MFSPRNRANTHGAGKKKKKGANGGKFNMFGGFLTNTKSKEGLMNQEGDPEEETKDINEVELQVTNFNKKQLKK